MRKFLLIGIVFVFIVTLSVSCTNTSVAQLESQISTLESKNAELEDKANQKTGETTIIETTEVKETITESTQAEAEREFSLSLAGNLYISGYTLNIWTEGDIAYLTSDRSFKVVDIKDRGKPQVLSSIDIEGGYMGFYVKDDYAYTPYQIWDQNTNEVKESGFEMIDVSNKENPKIVGKYKTEKRIINIFVAKEYIYATIEVTEIKDGYYQVLESGFEVIDVSNKENPKIVGQYNSQSQNGLNAMCVDEEGNFAYVLDDQYLKIIDLTNKDNLIEKGKLYLPIWSNFFYSKDNYLYAASNNTLEIIDVSDKEKPNLIGGVFSKGNIYNVFILEDFVYLTYSIYVFTTNNRELIESGLQVINLKSSKLAGEITINGEAMGIFVSDNYAYVATGPTGLQIVKLFDK